MVKFLIPLVFGALLSAQEAGDLAALTRGLTSLPVRGAPGPVIPLSPTAFPVVTAGKPRERAALVVAARAGEGRVVAIGHGGYLSASDGCETLVADAIAWCQNARKGAIAFDGPKELAETLAAAGWDVRPMKAAAITAHLKEFTTVVVDTHNIREDQIQPYQNWIRSGGGLVTSGLVWGWLQIHKKTDPTLHPGNRLLAPLGIAFGDGTLGPRKGSQFEVDGKPDPLVHPLQALAKLQAPAATAGDRKAEGDRLAAASHTLVAAIRTVDLDDPWLRPKLAALAASRPVRIPTDSRPLDRTDPLARVLLAMELDALDLVPTAATKAHPAAAEFPGAVPAEAARISRAITVTRGAGGWTSTGLYAPPGAMIDIHVPADAPTTGLGWRIGCHSDGIWDLDTWKRVPRVDRSGTLALGKTTIASPFGGLIYITDDARARGQVEVSIQGAVEAPLYVSGVTTEADWNRQRHEALAPWAEIATPRVVITVPSRVIRNLEHPEEVAQFWIRGLDACADLAVIPHDRSRPERMVTDVQISAGYMHSGYPIMTHLDVAEKFVTPAVMMKNPAEGWGFFHELGHNHQKGEWTFAGTGEVTNNLFTLYCLETVCGLKDGGHDAMDPVKSKERMDKHLRAGAPFSAWQSDPFLALTMYVQLRREFGWDPFKKVFASYRDSKSGLLPQSDDEKRDQWMTRFSKTIGRNLGPFFERWGVPVSRQALDDIKGLPVWLPADMPEAPAPHRN